MNYQIFNFTESPEVGAQVADEEDQNRDAAKIGQGAHGVVADRDAAEIGKGANGVVAEQGDAAKIGEGVNGVLLNRVMQPKLDKVQMNWVLWRGLILLEKKLHL